MKKSNGGFLLLLLLLGGSLAVLCYQGFLPYWVSWANDLPFGAMMESSSRLPGSFLGCWGDFYWIGSPNIAYQPNVTFACMALLSQAHYLKFSVPLSMFFMGFGAWFFFRQLGFSRMACVLGGLAAGLNMHFFSNANWGECNWDFCFGMIFIALGILVSPHIRQLWIKGALAGLSVGLAVRDGFDVGMIMSVYVGVFLAFYYLTSPGSIGRRIGITMVIGVLVVFSAVIMALSTISELVSTQLSGTVGEVQKDSDKRGAWIFSSQFSVPKLETLRVMIPGLFGYRMQDYTTTTNPSTYYWGRVAEDPRIDELESKDSKVRAAAATELHLPDQIITLMGGDDVTTREQITDKVKGFLQRRHTGNGEYAGILVCLLAVFGLVNSWRRVASPYSSEERRAVWFWGVIALFSLMAAWGRYSFVYNLIYHLPLVNNIRNPEKYMHPFEMALIILAGYGLEVICRRYMTAPAGRPEGFLQQLGSWGRRATPFEKRWAIGCAVAMAAAIIGYLIVSASRNNIEQYLTHNGFDTAQAPQIASFCVSEVEWFVVYFALSISVLLCILGGIFGGRRAIWAWILLSAIIICDLSRSDAPWVRYYDYSQKLSLNPVTEVLRQKPWEYRVDSRVWPSPGGSYLTPELAGLCHWWLENDYPFNDIQCLEIDQAPRMPLLDNNYLNDFFVNVGADDYFPATRLWQLTNTRYIFAGADWEDTLNQHGWPRNSFRAVLRMDVVAKPWMKNYEDPGDITVRTNSNGHVALLEFTHALPRVKLYANWMTTDDTNALNLLRSPQFDPEKTVLVAKDTPVTATPGSPDADAGTVKFVQYQSRDIILDADAKTPAVLLLNDRTADYWNVWVDHQPGSVLRCNYIMRGVFVPAGHHLVEFRYQPPEGLLFTSLGAFAVGILLGGYVIAANFRREPAAPEIPKGRKREEKRNGGK